MVRCLKCNEACSQDNELVLTVKNAPTLLRHYLCPLCADRWIAAMFKFKANQTYVEKEEKI